MASLGCRPHARWGFIRPGARGLETRLTHAPKMGLGPVLPAGRNGDLRERNGALLRAAGCLVSVEGSDYTNWVIWGTSSLTARRTGHTWTHSRHLNFSPTLGNIVLTAIFVR